MMEEFLWQLADYYVDCCNPRKKELKKNIKFLRGWIKRTIKARMINTRLIVFPGLLCGSRADMESIIRCSAGSCKLLSLDFQVEL